MIASDAKNVTAYRAGWRVGRNGLPQEPFEQTEYRRQPASWARRYAKTHGSGNSLTSIEPHRCRNRLIASPRTAVELNRHAKGESV